jgi:hypothetical protein
MKASMKFRAYPSYAKGSVKREGTVGRNVECAMRNSDFLTGRGSLVSTADCSACTHSVPQCHRYL